MKTLRIMGTMLALCSIAVAATDGGMGGFSKMKLIRVGEARMSLDPARVDEMRGGVQIELVSDDPDVGVVPISAGIMRFVYKEGDMPAEIHMEGNVDIRHPLASIKAERADWNFASGELVFSGNPIMNSEMIKELHSEKMVLNFEKNTFQAFAASADEVPIKGGDGFGAQGGTKAALRASDITDLPALLAKLKEESRADAASPGKVLVEKLDATPRQLLLDSPISFLVDNKDALLREFNRVVQEESLYDPEAFASVELDAETKELSAKETPTVEERVRLNRLLLHRAFPAEIAAP